jgi:electron transfer flavoprotein alpha subunit
MLHTREDAGSKPAAPIRNLAPDLYLGFGVSGAVQHLVGIRDSHTIVAVNTDRQAPLCQIADIVIEADAAEVAQELLARIDLDPEARP